MDDLTIRFKINDQSFSTLSDLEKQDRELIKQSFQQFEKQIRREAAIHVLNQTLNFKALNVLHIDVLKQKESPTDIG